MDKIIKEKQFLKGPVPVVYTDILFDNTHETRETILFTHSDIIYVISL